MRKIGDKELRELSIYRIIYKQDVLLLEVYDNDLDNDLEFVDFITKYYRDLGDDLEYKFDNYENEVINNIKNNIYYLD